MNPDEGATEERWNDAIDWLLNSRHCADPDIQRAFWGMVDGRCTREEADKGSLRNGKPIPDEGGTPGCDGCGDTEAVLFQDDNEDRYLCEACDTKPVEVTT